MWKENEILKRKITSNAPGVISSTNSRRIGDELRRIGQQVAELPRILEDEKKTVLLSRAAAASHHLGQMKSVNSSTSGVITQRLSSNH
jgi:hypothetical protein